MTPEPVLEEIGKKTQDAGVADIVGNLEVIPEEPEGVKHLQPRAR